MFRDVQSIVGKLAEDVEGALVGDRLERDGAVKQSEWEQVVLCSAEEGLER